MRAIAIAILITLVAGMMPASAHAQEIMIWRKVAETIPLGSKVKIRTIEGKSVKGTLMRVDDTSVMVKKDTRKPEPGVVVPYDLVSDIERDHGGGMSWGKALAIGAATGAGVILTLFVLALQLD